jgi:hypothetical protein
VLTTLREKLRCKEVWVKGARRFRNPDEKVKLITTKKGEGRICVTPLDEQPEPPNILAGRAGGQCRAGWIAARSQPLSALRDQ